MILGKPNITFRKTDLMMPVVNHVNYCDSLFCLHVLKHFGLGRYGDEINVNGYKLDLRNITGMLKNGGNLIFLLSITLIPMLENKLGVIGVSTGSLIIYSVGLLLSIGWLISDLKIAPNPN